MNYTTLPPLNYFLYTTDDIRHVFYLPLINIITLIETECLAVDDSENEVMLKLWIQLVDAQFRSNKVFRCQRGEITSTASAARRAQQCQMEGERKPLGKRGDAIIKAGDMEYGYGEASLKSLEDDKKNKYDRKLKTNKTMKDILQQQLNSLDAPAAKERVKSQLQTVGYQFSKYTLTVLYIDFIGNHCCRLRKMITIQL